MNRSTSAPPQPPSSLFFATLLALLPFAHPNLVSAGPFHCKLCFCEYASCWGAERFNQTVPAPHGQNATDEVCKAACPRLLEVPVTSCQPTWHHGCLPACGYPCQHLNSSNACGRLKEPKCGKVEGDGVCQHPLVGAGGACWGCQYCDCHYSDGHLSRKYLGHPTTQSECSAQGICPPTYYYNDTCINNLNEDCASNGCGRSCEETNPHFCAKFELGRQCNTLSYGCKCGFQGATAGYCPQRR